MNQTRITSTSDLEEIRGYFDSFPEHLFFTVSSERFRPVAGEEVVELTVADGHLFEGCETQERWERSWVPYMGKEDHVFGIVRDGKVVSSTWVGPIHDQFRDSDPPRGWESRVIAISGLYTETRYRHLGLGKRLVSYVTEWILQGGYIPIYWTEPDNIISQALVKGLGYWQVMRGP